MTMNINTIFINNFHENPFPIERLMFSDFQQTVHVAPRPQVVKKSVGILKISSLFKRFKMFRFSNCADLLSVLYDFSKCYF